MGGKNTLWSKYHTVHFDLKVFLLMHIPISDYITLDIIQIKFQLSQVALLHVNVRGMGSVIKEVALEVCKKGTTVS